MIKWQHLQQDTKAKNKKKKRERYLTFSLDGKTASSVPQSYSSCPEYSDERQLSSGQPACREIVGWTVSLRIVEGI